MAACLILRVAPHEVLDFSRRCTVPQIVCERDDREQDDDENGQSRNLHTGARTRRLFWCSGPAQNPQPNESSRERYPKQIKKDLQDNPDCTKSLPRTLSLSALVRLASAPARSVDLDDEAL